MDKTFQLEFWAGDEAIDHKDFDTMPAIPNVGDKIYLNCSNSAYNDALGYYFQVLSIRYLFFGGDVATQKIMIKLESIGKGQFEARF